MKRFLGQYIYHNNSFIKRGFLQINNDKSFETRGAKPGEEWGNTQFINGILFPVVSLKSDKELLNDLRGLIPELISNLSGTDNILNAIEQVYMDTRETGNVHWFALKGIDLSDLKSVINISVTVL